MFEGNGAEPASSRPVGVLAKARSGLVGWLEPGSSLLETSSKSRNKSHQAAYCVIPGRRAPLGWFEPGSSLLEKSA